MSAEFDSIKFTGSLHWRLSSIQNDRPVVIDRNLKFEVSRASKLEVSISLLDSTTWVYDKVKIELTS